MIKILMEFGYLTPGYCQESFPTSVSSSVDDTVLVPPIKLSRVY
jgi:hypothetical protein